MTAKTSPPEVIRFATAFAPHIEPYATEDNDGKTIHVYDAKFISIIANYLGARQEIQITPDGEVGVKRADSWSGLMGMATRDETDLAMAGIPLTEERFHDVNFSYPYYISTVTFLTDAPQPMPKNLAIFLPFTYTLWLALVGVTVAMSVFFYFLLDRRMSYQRMLLSTFRSTLENSVDFKMTKPAVKMAAFAWILGMFIVTNGYKAVLLSFLSFPTMIGIRDVAGLAKAAAVDSFKCFTYAGSYVGHALYESDNPSWKAIGNCLLRNEVSGDPLEHFVNDSHGKAFVGPRIMAVPYDKRYFLSEDNFFFEEYGIALSKTFCCSEDLDRMIHRLIPSGYFEKSIGQVNFLKFLKNPPLHPEITEAASVISLGDMSGAFYVLISGWVAGIIAFLFEVLMQRCN